MTGSHAALMKEVKNHFQPVLDNSSDGVYLWLDDGEMVCNEKLAKMFGYKNAAELCRVESFLGDLVAEKDQKMFAKQFHTHVANLSRPVTFKFTAKMKNGKTFAAETDMIPITFQGHALAYHFVRVRK
jgi:PAS domain S-box-containing protein